ncbi:MAG: hypothetical protein ACR2JG_04315 [Geodermatophilaceae bacterium]
MARGLPAALRRVRLLPLLGLWRYRRRGRGRPAGLRAGGWLGALSRGGGPGGLMPGELFGLMPVVMTRLGVPAALLAAVLLATVRAILGLTFPVGLIAGLVTAVLVTAGLVTAGLVTADLTTAVLPTAVGLIARPASAVLVTAVGLIAGLLIAGLVCAVLISAVLIGAVPIPAVRSTAGRPVGRLLRIGVSRRTRISRRRRAVGGNCLRTALQSGPAHLGLVVTGVVPGRTPVGGLRARRVTRRAPVVARPVWRRRWWQRCMVCRCPAGISTPAEPGGHVGGPGLRGGLGVPAGPGQRFGGSVGPRRLVLDGRRLLGTVPGSALGSAGCARLVADVGKRGRPAVGIGAPDLLRGFICIVGGPWLVVCVGSVTGSCGLARPGALREVAAGIEARFARHGSLDRVVVGLVGAGFLGHETASRFLVEA